MTAIFYKVEHIDYLPYEPVAGWAPGEAEVSTVLDSRTCRIKFFITKPDAIEYIRAMQKTNGKWLASITLKKVVETEETIDD